LGFFIFQEIPENPKIFEEFQSGVRKDLVGQGMAELNEMVQYFHKTALDLMDVCPQCQAIQYSYLEIYMFQVLLHVRKIRYIQV